METFEFNGESLVFERGNYGNGNLAVMVYTADGEPYVNLTVNLGEPLPEGYAHLDVNNCPEGLLESIIDEQPFVLVMTGAYGSSGYCSYPLAYISL